MKVWVVLEDFCGDLEIHKVFTSDTEALHYVEVQYSLEGNKTNYFVFTAEVE